MVEQRENADRANNGDSEEDERNSLGNLAHGLFLNSGCLCNFVSTASFARRQIDDSYPGLDHAIVNLNDRF